MKTTLLCCGLIVSASFTGSAPAFSMQGFYAVRLTGGGSASGIQLFSERYGTNHYLPVSPA